MTKRTLDKIVVVDVESTCWSGDPPLGEPNEIIEIGICILDIATGERQERDSILVRPERSKISAFCTGKNTLTQEQVDRGIGFADACELLISKFKSSERPWASYGDYDRLMFERQCRERDIAYPFGKSHTNVKNLFAVFCGLSREVGMAGALQHLRIPLEGTHHRGGDDAWNIAAILSRIIHAARLGGMMSQE